MRLRQTTICQTTPLWVGVAFPLKGMDIPTVNNPGKGLVLGPEMRIWQVVLRMKAEKLFLLSLHPGIGLIRTLGQGAAWNCSSDRCSAIPGDGRGAVRFYDILIFPNQQGVFLITVTILTLLSCAPFMAWLGRSVVLSQMSIWWQWCSSHYQESAMCMDRDLWRILRVDGSSNYSQHPGLNMTNSPGVLIK